MKSAVVTGITGQDGAYLAELLLAEGYKVFGSYRRTSSTNFWRIQELGIQYHPELRLVEYDLTDPGSSHRLLELAQPNEVYNYAAGVLRAQARLLATLPVTENIWEPWVAQVSVLAKP